MRPGLLVGQLAVVLASCAVASCTLQTPDLLTDGRVEENSDAAIGVPDAKPAAIDATVADARSAHDDAEVVVNVADGV